MDPRLALQLRLVLSFFCELSNFRTARSEQHPIIALRFLVLVPSYWHEHWANTCTGNNAHRLSTPLLLRLRLSGDCTIQSFGHCSARCARLDYACLVSFLESKQLLYLLTPNPHLDRVFICILHSSQHVTPIWISHRARQGFLHGNSSLFGFCIGCDDTHDSCISIHQLDRFRLS